MANAQRLARSRYAQAGFWACVLIVLYAFCRILRPFAEPIAWATVLVTACHPLYRRLSRSLGGRRRLASLLACLLISAIIVVPVLILSVLLAKESVDAYGALQAFLHSPQFEASIRFKPLSVLSKLSDLAGQFIDVDTLDLPTMLLELLNRASQMLVSASAAIVSSLTGFVVSFFIMLMTMYFFFLDSTRLVDLLKQFNPMPPRYGEMVLRRFHEVSIATLQGSVLIGLAQGTVGAIAFTMLGLPSPLLWGTAMAFASLIPLIGSGLVWAPVAAYLFLTGSIGKGVALSVVGFGVIGTMDNLVRLVVVGGRMKLHTLLVFFSVLGGLRAFGFLGLVLGPLVAAMVQTLLTIYRLEFHNAAPGRPRLSRRG